MTTAVTLASRRAAPIPTTTGTHAHQQADLVHLHMAACNALHAALRHLTGPDTGPSQWASAAARAHRAMTALHRGNTIANEQGAQA
jgi:hypothetical protein